MRAESFKEFLGQEIMQNILYYWFCSDLNMRAESFQEFSVADNVKDKHDV